MSFNLGAAEFTPSWLKKPAAATTSSSPAPSDSPPPKAPAATAAKASEPQPSKLSPDAVSFQPRSRAVVHAAHQAGSEARRNNVAEAVNQKSVSELEAIIAKSSFKLTAASFIPPGLIPKLAAMRSPILQPKPLEQSGPMVLRDSWSLYFIDRSLVTENNFDPILVFRMDCIEEFWRVFNNIPPASDMPPQSTYYLFRQDVAPKWEDTRNRDGGCWQLRLKSTDVMTLDEVWVRICCRTIGESWKMTAHGEAVNGLVLKSRNGFHTLQIWVTEKKADFPHDLMDAIEVVLPSFDIDYYDHQTLREHSVSSQKESKRKGGKRKGGF